MYNFYSICVLFKSLVLCGVVPRLYTQVSRAEVTTSIFDGVIYLQVCQMLMNSIVVSRISILKDYNGPMVKKNK